MPQSMASKRVPIWLDCDPGHDDAFAILMCAHHPSIDFLGISTVHGNASLDQTSRNASSLLIAFGRPNIPIYPGATKPFCRPAVHAADIHGDSGLDGTDLLPRPEEVLQGTKQTVSAVTAMYEAVIAHPAGTPWIVATGTLTNVALLLAVYPAVADHLAGVSFMGGAFEDTLATIGAQSTNGTPEPKRIGNITPWAEFNIYCDPESAEAILSHPGLKGKVIIIPLDLTHTVLATAEVQKQVLYGPNDRQTPLRRMMHDLLLFFAHTYSSKFGLTAGPPLHDPVAVAAVLHRAGAEQTFAFSPSGVEAKSVDVKVITAGRHGDNSELGRTVKDPNTQTRQAFVPDALDVKAFWQSLNQCLDRAESISSMGR